MKSAQKLDDLTRDAVSNLVSVREFTDAVLCQLLCETSHSVKTAVPSRKSSIVMASKGLWLPLAFLTKIIPMGTPHAANAAASCDAGLPRSIARMPSAAAPVV